MVGLYNVFMLLGGGHTRKPSRVSQTASSGGAIPNNLRQSLDERIALYVEYQRNDQWDRVGDLIGQYLGGQKKQKMSTAQKQWVIAKLRERPMIGFVYQKTNFCSWILGKPLHEKYWDIEGIAEYRDADQVVKGRAIILVYLDHGKWFFAPRVVDKYGWRSMIPPVI